MYIKKYGPKNAKNLAFNNVKFLLSIKNITYTIKLLSSSHLSPQLASCFVIILHCQALIEIGADSLPCTEKKDGIEAVKHSSF